MTTKETKKRNNFKELTEEEFLERSKKTYEEAKRRGKKVIGTQAKIEVSEEEMKTWDQKKEKNKRGNKKKDPRGEFVQGMFDSNVQLENDEEWTYRHDICIMKLIPYALYEKDNPYGQNGVILNEKKEPATEVQLFKIMGLKRAGSQIKKDREIFDSLIKKFEIIELKDNPKKENNKMYVLNPRFFQFGERKLKKGEYFTKVFSKKMEEVLGELNKSAKTAKAIGLLRLFLTRFQYQTYYIVSTAEQANMNILKDTNLSVIKNLSKHPEIMREEMEFISQNEIERITKLEARTIKNYIEYLKDAGAIVYDEFRLKNNKKSRKIVIHPDLMYRLNDHATDDYAEFVRSRFSTRENTSGIFS